MCPSLGDATSNYRPALRCTPEDHRLWEEAGFPTPGTRGPEPGLQEVLGEHVAAQQPVLLTLCPCRGGPTTDDCRMGLPGTHPWVVEAVTLTTMMVALVRICCRFSLFLHLSRLLPSSWGRRGHEGEARGLRRV